MLQTQFDHLVEVYCMQDNAKLRGMAAPEQQGTRFTAIFLVPVSAKI